MDVLRAQNRFTLSKRLQKNVAKAIPNVHMSQSATYHVGISCWDLKLLDLSYKVYLDLDLVRDMSELREMLISRASTDG